MIAVGSEAPDFKLVSQFDSEYSLSEFKGKKECNAGVLSI
jgi:peroxiredoxin